MIIKQWLHRYFAAVVFVALASGSACAMRGHDAVRERSNAAEEVGEMLDEVLVQPQDLQDVQQALGGVHAVAGNLPVDVNVGQAHHIAANVVDNIVQDLQGQGIDLAGPADTVLDAVDRYMEEHPEIGDMQPDDVVQVLQDRVAALEARHPDGVTLRGGIQEAQDLLRNVAAWEPAQNMTLGGLARLMNAIEAQVAARPADAAPLHEVMRDAVANVDPELVQGIVPAGVDPQQFLAGMGEMIAQGAPGAGAAVAGHGAGLLRQAGQIVSAQPHLQNMTVAEALRGVANVDVVGGAERAAQGFDEEVNGLYDQWDAWEQWGNADQPVDDQVRSWAKVLTLDYPKDPADYTLTERVLHKGVEFPVYTAKDHDTGVRVYQHHDGWARHDVIIDAEIKAAVNGYDAARVAFFLAQLLVEKKFFEQFKDYVVKSLLSSFDQRKQVVIDVYKASLLLDEEEKPQQQVIDAFLQEFCIKKKFSASLFRSMGLFMVMRWLIDEIEDSIAPNQGANTILLNWIKYLVVVNRAERRLEEGGAGAAAHRENFSCTLHPVQIMVDVARHVLGMSLVEGNLATLRPIALSLTQGCYPPDHAYHKFLGALQTVTDHRMFALSKRLFMWYYCIDRLYGLYEESLKKYIQLHDQEFMTVMNDIVIARKGSQEEIDADEVLKQFVHKACEGSFFTWLRHKNAMYSRGSFLVERVLMIPPAIELGKWMFNFVKARVRT